MNLLQGRQEKCDVILRCKEKQRLHIKGGTYVQANEGDASCLVVIPGADRPGTPGLPKTPIIFPALSGSIEMQATLRNSLGFAEQIQVCAHACCRCFTCREVLFQLAQKALLMWCPVDPSAA